ncbi:carboxymuconolactone decarboxylase family protein [Amycolatopsis antarctica]|nr:carboxymuconolactone decarboxylase family protein [Amycolatopsis antarctica]
MTDDRPATTWRDRVREYDEDGHSAMVAYLGHVTAKPDIPEAYRELILFAVSTGLRFAPSMRTHGARALESGATHGQLVHAVQLAALSGGFTCLIEGMSVLAELDRT